MGVGHAERQADKGDGATITAYSTLVHARMHLRVAVPRRTGPDGAYIDASSCALACTPVASEVSERYVLSLLWLLELSGQ